MQDTIASTQRLRRGSNACLVEQVGSHYPYLDTPNNKVGTFIASFMLFILDKCTPLPFSHKVVAQVTTALLLSRRQIHAAPMLAWIYACQAFVFDWQAVADKKKKQQK